MVYKSTLFQWTFLVLILKKGESCDGGWLQNGGNCYKIFTERANKSVAETICLEHKSALASMSNVDEEKFLMTQLSLANTTEQNFWVGLHKIENVLMWNNRQTVTTLLPVIDASSAPQSSDCFVYNGAKVVFLDCSAEASFVCEQWKLTDDKPSRCEPDAHKDAISDKCYWYSHMPLSKAGSEVICTLKHGGLVTMRGELFPLSLALIILLSPPPIPNPFVFWTSLMFKNGTLLHEDGTEYKNGDFSLKRGEGDCVALVSQRATPIELHQKPCLEEALGFCESNLDRLSPDRGVIFGTKNNNPGEAKCPVGINWEEHDETGFCYWETSYETPRLSWQDAREYCRSYGGDLASFQTKEEERIALGFQFGQIEHSFWTGLYYDEDRDDYMWGDGSAMNYTNWGDGQPNNVNRRMRCGVMNSLEKSWEMAYCGMLNWFICKAPKQVNPPSPVPPTAEPLIKCQNSTEYFFQGYCYQKIGQLKGWHRAQQHCENLGSNLVSLHSEDEVNFVIRLLAESGAIRGNRLWIGLNSLGLRGSFKWTDGKPYEFANWDVGEPNNFLNQEKCVNMYSQHGMWNDENCNSVMNFICKRKNSTTTVPLTTTTPAPVVGNCKKDWYLFEGKCFLPVGTRDKERMSWRDAGLYCARHGGYLASIRDPKDQAFVYYVMQNLKMDTWIGLHDSIHSNVFFWTDNSPLYYTNWARGKPSTFSVQDDCVAVVYGEKEGGQWKDTNCSRVLPFICQNQPDPSITEPSRVRGSSCLQPNTYMKVGLSCYNMFDTLSTWEEAEDVCVKDGGHLVSIYDMEKQAVVDYLTTISSGENETFWIGLQLNGTATMKWANGWPLSYSRWGKNEPHEIFNKKTCFYTTTSRYWQGASCSDKKKFICHKTVEEPTKPVPTTSGSCSSSSQWRFVGNACLFFGLRYAVDWHTANFRCYSEGANLVSFHSMEMLNEVGNFLGTSVTAPVFIGLTKNSEGGFEWADGSPVDFVNWDQGQPQDEPEFRCVEMRMDNFKWRLSSCDYSNYYICGKGYVQGSTVAPSQSPFKSPEDKDTSTISGAQIGLHPGAVAAIVIVLIIVGITAAVVLVYYRPWAKDFNRYRVHSEDHITSFENSTYDVHNIDFHDKNVLFANN